MDDRDRETLAAIKRSITGIALRLDDMLSAIHRVETEVGAVRGSLSAARRDINDAVEHVRDHECRLRSLEEGEQHRADSEQLRDPCSTDETQIMHPTLPKPSAIAIA